MKIAFVYDMVYPFKIGGVEKRIWELSRRLIDTGHEVHIFGLKLWDGPSDFLHDGIMVHGVGRKFPFHTGKSGRRAIFPALWFSAGLWYSLLRKGKFDLIDCQNFPYFPCFSVKFVSFLRKTPLLITWHEVWGIYWRDYMGFIGECGIAVERLVKGLTHHHAAVSKTTRVQLQHLGVKDPIVILPNGVDLEKIHMILPSPEQSDIIFIGRLIRDKHVDVLLGALGLLHTSFPDIRCFIIGRGPEEENLKEEAVSYGLQENVRFIGFVKDQEDLIRLMKASRLCVLPSTREGFGMVALEALACGVPVVTARHPGNAICDLVGIGGLRIVPLTIQDFADAIREQLQSTSLKGSFQIDDSWDWTAITRKWLEMAGEVTKPSPKSKLKKDSGELV